MRHHLNNDNKAARCTAASPESCPFYKGEHDSRHYDTKEQAQAAAEAIMESKFSSPLSKSEPWQMTLETPEEHANAMSTVTRLAQEGDEDGLNQFIESRIHSKAQDQALEALHKLKAEEDAIKEYKKQAEEGIKKHNAKRAPVKLDDDILAEYERELSAVGTRERNLKLLDNYENKKALEKKLGDYRSVAGVAALAVSTLRENRERAEGTFLTYDKDYIGDLDSEGSYEPDSPEWHAARARGIGGSDVGAIMRVDKDFAASNYENMLRAKLGLPPKDEPETGPESAIGRGNNWEEKIRQMYADNNPHLNVAFSKDSWVGRGDKSYLKANFDGLELDDNGNAVGIVEIKTGRSYDGKWGDPADGIKGVPTGYLYQAIYYARNANLKHGTVVALLDDRDYREYKFSMDDPEVKEISEKIGKEVDVFHVKLQSIVARHRAGENVFATDARKGIPKTHKADQIAENLMLYTGASQDKRDEYIASVNEALKQAKVDSEISGVDINSARQKNISKLYAAYNYEKHGRDVEMVGIDIETNGLSPSTGRVIEASVVSIDRKGEAKVEFDSLFDVPERAHQGAGMGAVDVHHITPDMVKGRPTFEDTSSQKRLLNSLKGKTIVSHNAPFERGYLVTHLPGFAEAVDAGEVKFLDTMNVVRDVMPQTENNTMKSFTEGNREIYAEAHRSLPDTDMMMRSLYKLQTGRGYNIFQDTV